jgi:hypothetical protein
MENENKELGGWFVSRNLNAIEFDHNLIDIGIDVNFNVSGTIAAVWYVSKDGACECQNYESCGIACRHQCAVSQKAGVSTIIGGSIHPFYKHSTHLLEDGHFPLSAIAGGGVYTSSAVARKFNSILLRRKNVNS